MPAIITAEFTPSTEWQEVPEGIVLPNGGEYRMDMNTGKNTVRWKEPVPGPVQYTDDGLPPIVNLRDCPIPDNIPAEEMNVCPDCEKRFQDCECYDGDEYHSYKSRIFKSWEDREKRELYIAAKIHARTGEDVIEIAKQLHWLNDAQLKETEESLKVKVEPKPPEKPVKTTESDEFSKYPSVSILEIANRQIDKSKYLLGDGWLERGDGGILFSGAGIGKSVVTNQMGILWSVGRPAFETQPNGPLRVLIFQAEDGNNDQVRMATMIHHFGFTEEEKKLAGENCRIVTCNDRTDTDFFNLLQYKIKEFNPDIVIINPLHSYMSGDVKEEVAVKEFLRQKLTPSLKKYDVGALIVHHTPKQNYRDTSNWRVTDYMYGMAGAAELTNYPRFVIAIEPTGDPSVFQMIAAKRWKRSGWTTAKQHIAYSDNPDVMMWIPASDSQIKNSNNNSKMNPVQLFELIPDNGIIDPAAWYILAQDKYGVSEKSYEKVRSMLRNPTKKGYKQWVDYSEKRKVWFLTLAGAERKGILSSTHELQPLWDESSKKLKSKIAKSVKENLEDDEDVTF